MCAHAAATPETPAVLANASFQLASFHATVQLMVLVAFCWGMFDAVGRVYGQLRLFNGWLCGWLSFGTQDLSSTLRARP
jgi:hypothetical protein